MTHKKNDNHNYFHQLENFLKFRVEKGVDINVFIIENIMIIIEDMNS